MNFFNLWNAAAKRSYINANGKRVFGAANAAHELKNLNAVPLKSVGIMAAGLLAAGGIATAITRELASRKKGKTEITQAKHSRY